MQMICFGVRILIEMQYDAGYPLAETNDIGYGVLHECGIRYGTVHREVSRYMKTAAIRRLFVCCKLLNTYRKANENLSVRRKCAEPAAFCCEIETFSILRV